VSLLTVVTILLLIGLRLPTVVSDQAVGAARPLSIIVRQPAFSRRSSAR
jgi:hypothetical protein